MSAVPKPQPPKRMTEEEYLAFERAAEFKHEFFDGVLYPLHNPYGDLQAMAGATKPHNRVKENLIVELGGRFKGGPCQTFSSDQKVRLSDTGRFAYPDIVVVCGEPEDDPKDEHCLANPRVVIEVLSPSTEGYDRGFKAEQYRRSPTVQEVVFVAQDAPRVERYTRQPDGTWLLKVFADPAGEFELASVPVRVPLADVYRGVKLPAGG
jgi:Uma2 family endonuclease